MTTVNVKGVDIRFPFEPYEVQTKYMAKVIDCLTLKKHGVLESPTGTGKTLSLLCSTLAWMKQENIKIAASGGTRPSLPDLTNLDFVATEKHTLRVIYASRTHSQLNKALQELQKTEYKDVFATILGSRDQLCIHPGLTSQTSVSKNAMCRLLVKSKSCIYGKQLEFENYKIDTLTDIEDLVKFGKKNVCCPYYLARDLQSRADIVFMPYNYLFDDNIKRKLHINLMASIVILDEGHNVNKVAEEAASVSISSTQIAIAISETSKLMLDEKEKENSKRLMSLDELCSFKQILMNLEKAIDDTKVSNDNGYPGSYIFSILEKAGLLHSNVQQFIEVCEIIFEALHSENDITRRAGVYNTLADTLSVLFKQDYNYIGSPFFKTYVEEQNNLTKGSFSGMSVQNSTFKVVHFWCLHPGYGIKKLLSNGVHSLIVTSGTLAPMYATLKELDLEDAVTFESPHVIKSDQVIAHTLKNGPNKHPLSNSYRNRENNVYWNEAGTTILNFSRLIPDGILIFFPSYTSLNKAIDFWKASNLWASLTSVKPYFVEESSKYKFDATMAEYRQAVDSGKGAILLGVCRGKISEGMDFSDSYGRAVMLFGLPYPPLYDPKIKLKKSYLDQSCQKPKDMNGQTWYRLEATRAVNQALGRVIRHINDFGVILLCDVKFLDSDVSNSLSKWIIPMLKRSESFGETVSALRQFFRTKYASVPSSSSSNVSILSGSGSASTFNSNSMTFPSGSRSSLALTSDTYYAASSTSSSSVLETRNICTPSNKHVSKTVCSEVNSTVSAPISLARVYDCDDDKDDQPGPSTSSEPVFHIDINEPAKRRKIAVIQVTVTDIQPSGNDPREIARITKLNECKNVLVRLRNALEDSSYGQFDSILRSYNSGGSLDEYISQLTTLFPANDSSFAQMFRDCEVFLEGGDRSKFIQFLKMHYK